MKNGDIPQETFVTTRITSFIQFPYPIYIVGSEKIGGRQRGKVRREGLKDLEDRIKSGRVFRISIGIRGWVPPSSVFFSRLTSHFTLLLLQCSRSSPWNTAGESLSKTGMKNDGEEEGGMRFVLFFSNNLDFVISMIV